MGAALTVKTDYGKPEDVPSVPVVDADGNPMHEGDFAQNIDPKHNWLKVGQIVEIRKADRVQVNGRSHLSYIALDRHESGIYSDQVRRVDLTPKERQTCELAKYYGELGRINEILAKFQGEKARVETIIRQTEAVKHASAN